MKGIIKFLVLGALVSLIASCGSVVKYRSGDDSLGYLKGQKAVKVKIDFSKSSMGNFSSESEFVADKVREKNRKKAGSGNDWKREWDSDKENFGSYFQQQLNSTLSKRNIDTQFSTSAKRSKLTVVVHITHLETGFNVGIMSKPSHLSARIELYNSKNLKKALTTYEVRVARGNAAYSQTQRLEAAFNNLAYGFGKFLAGKLK